MSDVRVQKAIKIVDPTSDALAAAVVALSADNVAATIEGLAVASFPHWFDGSTWDRALGDATDGLLVNLGVNNDVNEPNFISTNNSTTSTLGVSGNFTGTGDDVSDYAAVTIIVDSSHDSAVDGMTFEFSTNDSDWDDMYQFTYTAADGARRFQFPTTAQYFRVNYTNGGTGQTTFRVQTILHKHNTLTSVHRIVDNLDPDRSAQIVKAAIIAQAAGSGDFVPVQATASGNFKIALEEYEGVPSGDGVTTGALRIAIGGVAHDVPDGSNPPVKIGGRAQEPEGQPEEVADNDRVDALFDRNGYLRVRGDFDPSFADINDSTSGNNEIIAAQAAGKRIAVWAVLVVSDGTVDVRFEDGAAGTAFTGQMPLQAREGFAHRAGGLVPLWVGGAATNLNLELSAAINVHGTVSYTVIDD